jgi:hypothetical protein
MAAGLAPDLEFAEVVKAGVKKICTGTKTFSFSITPRLSSPFRPVYR